LYVCECPSTAAPDSAAEAFFQVVVCPSAPLQVGLVAHLHLILGSPDTVSFIPQDIAAPLTAFPINICGPITRVQARCGDFLYLTIQNQVPGAPVVSAHLRIPWSPG
ncbi:hypothetical protein OH77DRAFT_1379950, partial [Trametes cingulata]